MRKNEFMVLCRDVKGVFEVWFVSVYELRVKATIEEVNFME